jgi:hypothetical protein
MWINTDLALCMRLFAFLLDTVLCLNTHFKWSVRELRALGLRKPVSTFGKNLVLVTHGQGTSRCTVVPAIRGAHLACLPTDNSVLPKADTGVFEVKPLDYIINVYFCHFTK